MPFKNLTTHNEPASPVYPFNATGSTTKLFKLGTRLELPDGRLFRYCKAGSYGLVPQVGAAYVSAAWVSAVAPVQVRTGSLAIGSTILTLTNGTTNSGVLGDGAIAANELEGGYVTLNNGSATGEQFCGIIANTAATSGATFEITIDQPLVTALTATSSFVEVFPNLYAYLQNIAAHGSSYRTFLGIPTSVIAAGSYGWLQRRGPVWGTSNSVTGAEAGGRDVYFAGDGSLRTLGATAETLFPLQYAGYTIDASESGSSNSPLIWLNLE